MIKTKLSKTKKNFNGKLLQDFIFTIIIFAIMIIIISNPKRFTSGTVSGLKLFFYSVLPGLFPFMLLTKLLTEIGFLFKITSKLDRFSYKLFGTSGISIYVFLMSIISGYPIGSKIISDLYDKNIITESDAKKMSVFCTTSGPGFVIATIGISMFGGHKIGIILYASHIFSSIILGVLFNLLTRKEPQIISQNTSGELLLNKNNESVISKTVVETINSLFIVGAYITIFYLITELFDAFNIITLISTALSKITSKLGIIQQTLKGFLYGMIEVTRGAKELSLSVTPTSIALCSGILSFSGISIIMQSMTFLKTCKIKAHNFFLSKCVHMILSIFICFILIFIIL